MSAAHWGQASLDGVDFPRQIVRAGLAQNDASSTERPEMPQFPRRSSQRCLKIFSCSIPVHCGSYKRLASFTDPVQPVTVKRPFVCLLLRHDFRCAVSGLVLFFFLFFILSNCNPLFSSRRAFPGFWPRAATWSPASAISIQQTGRIPPSARLHRNPISTSFPSLGCTRVLGPSRPLRSTGFGLRDPLACQAIIDLKNDELLHLTKRIINGIGLV